MTSSSDENLYRGLAGHFFSRKFIQRETGDVDTGVQCHTETKGDLGDHPSATSTQVPIKGE